MDLYQQNFSTLIPVGSGMVNSLYVLKLSCYVANSSVELGLVIPL